MAVTNAFFIPSLSLQRSAIGEFGHGFPRFTTTKSLPISPAFFPCRSTLSTKLTLQATPDCTNSVGSTSFGAQESRELKSHGSFHLARLFIRPGERVSSWRTTSSDFRLQTFMSDVDSDPVPMPVVLIDQDTDPVSTIVQLSFGDRLGALIDTMKALKDLGLDVLKGTVSTEGAIKQTKLFITRLDTGRKVEDPDMLERIRLTVIDNLLKYHPESSERLAMGEAFGIKAPVKPDVDVATHIHVQEDGPKRSLLCIETADRPGLLMEIIKIMADINVDVESAEIDTEGLVAKDKFHVSYRGAALNSSLSQVLVNCLRYYLRRPQTDEDSY